MLPIVLLAALAIDKVVDLVEDFLERGGYHQKLWDLGLGAIWKN